MASSLPVLSPLVTRILQLSGFPPELKTRDIQAIFAPWEDDRGGFKIKWVDDTTALIIFSDPAVAKRAYLHTLMSPPPTLNNADGAPAKLKPYDGGDASAIIASVQNRTRSRSNAHHGHHHSHSSASTLAGFDAATAASLAAAASGAAASPPSQHSGTLTSAMSPSQSGGGALGMSSPRHRAQRSLGGGAGGGVGAGGAGGSGASTGGSASFSPSGLGHRRHPSGSNPSGLPPKPLAAALFDAANGGPSPAHHLSSVVAAEQAKAAAAAAATTHASSPGAVAAVPTNPLQSLREDGTIPDSLELGGKTSTATGNGKNAGGDGGAASPAARLGAPAEIKSSPSSSSPAPATAATASSAAGKVGA